jgi:hypothetical protein
MIIVKVLESGFPPQEIKASSRGAQTSAQDIQGRRLLYIGNFAQDGWARGSRGGRDVGGLMVPALEGEQCKSHRFFRLRGYSQLIGGSQA